MKTILTFCISVAIAAPSAADAPEKKPSPDSRGQVLAWKAKDGLAFEYFVPKSYEPKKGANLTLVLHGSNLDRRWTLANHPAGRFRPDDIVVSPDGTTPNGHGGFNFMGEPKDLARLHALLEELRGVFNVRQTFVYGHSQGSFFAFYFAGEYSKEVDGICAASSGCWSGTKIGKFGFHQAIGILHGTDDPLVPYGQSRGALDLYRKAGYPSVHLRSLHGWGHQPEAIQASHVLAWCEGMTTSDPSRARASLDHLVEGTEGFGDYAALYQVAARIAGRIQPDLPGVSPEDKAKAGAVAAAVESLAAKHADVLRKSMPKAKGGSVEPGPWVGHFLNFLDGFDGVPSRDAFAKEWQPLLDKHEEAAVKRLRPFWQKPDKERAEAFDLGLAAAHEGFLYYEVPRVLSLLAEWEKQAKALKLSKAALAAYSKAVPPLLEAREAGAKAFGDLNRKEGRIH